MMSYISFVSPWTMVDSLTDEEDRWRTMHESETRVLPWAGFTWEYRKKALDIPNDKRLNIVTSIMELRQNVVEGCKN